MVCNPRISDLRLGFALRRAHTLAAVENRTAFVIYLLFGWPELVRAVLIARLGEALVRDNLDKIWEANPDVFGPDASVHVCAMRVSRTSLSQEVVCGSCPINLTCASPRRYGGRTGGKPCALDLQLRIA
jgi:hypothetical protein